MSNIHNYPLEAFQINDEDFYDVDYWNGTTFESRKISGATLKAVIGAAASNIYSIDGSLISDRILDLNGSDLLFEDLATNRRISISDALILIEAGDTDIDGIRPIFLKSDNISLVRKDNLRISLDTGALSANRNQQFQDNNGVIALLSDIPSGDNIYNASGSLTAARSLSLNTFQLFISDLAGTTKFEGGNLIEISANAGQEALMKFLAGNGEKRGISFTDQGVDRWEWVAEGLEAGANSGTNFVIYRYDDAGILLGKAFEINRATGAIRFSDAYTFPIADGNPGDTLQTDGAGNISFQAAESSIDSFYAFDMSQAAGYSWNGQNVNPSALVTINESIRAQALAGGGGSDGCFVNSTMPKYYTPGQSLRITINVTYLAVGGDFKIFLGVQEPRFGGLIGNDSSTIWNSQVQSTSFAESSVTMVFIVSGFVELFAGSPFALKFYRRPGDPQDTFTGDIYINSVKAEIQ